MKVIFTNLAQKELNDAAAYYELEYPGLGKRFKEEIKKSIQRITEHPRAWSIERGIIRRALLHKSPYKILYSIEKDHILILAIAHQHRKPDYWVQL
ncbi:plasmid stabilization system protein [bacterium BMS3Abin03]|nr:plasmid stabilization system protein [bacterium BMS3Abin03]